MSDNSNVIYSPLLHVVEGYNMFIVEFKKQNVSTIQQ